MPDWRPILAAPFVAALLWTFAFAVAGTQEARSIETRFAGMILLPIVGTFFWIAAAILVLVARFALRSVGRRAEVGVAVLATLVNVSGVVVIFGETITGIGGIGGLGGEGWPTDVLSISTLIIAAGISLLPIVWVWRSMPGSPAVAPRTAVA